MLFSANLFFNSPIITALVRRMVDKLVSMGERWEDFNTPLEVIKPITKVIPDYQSRGGRISMTSVRFDPKEANSKAAMNAHTIFITLYGEEASGCSSDCFLEVESCYTSSMRLGDMSRLTITSQ